MEETGDVEFESPHLLHHHGLVTDQALALSTGRQRGPCTRWDRGVVACSQSNRWQLASGRRLWCDLALDVAGLEVDRWLGA